MYRSVLLSLFPILSAVMVHGQDNIRFFQEEAEINDGTHPVISVFIPAGKKKEVEKRWRKKVKKWGNKRNNDNPTFIDDAENDDIFENPFDLYARVEKTDKDGVILLNAFDLGGAYLNPSEHPDVYERAREVIREFAVSMAKKAYEARIEKEVEKLEELTDQMDDVEDDQEDLNETIEEKKEAIAEAEEAIKEAEARLEELREIKKEKEKAIEAQKKAIEKIEEKKDGIGD